MSAAHDPNRLFPFLLFLVLVGDAHAGDRATALKQFQRGNQHYKLGEYKEALAIFKEAFRSYEDPAFLFNIAQCERLLAHDEDAIREYKMYLAESPDAPNRDEVRTLIAGLQKRLDDERARTLEERRAATPPPPPSPTLSTPPAITAVRASIAPSSSASLTASAPARPAKTPAYKKWWVWTLVGGVVAGGVAAGLGVALTRSTAAPMVPTTLGTGRF